MRFSEDPLTPSQQIDYLAARGMVFENPKQAEAHLQHINFHRLRPYWQPFETPKRQGGYTFDPPIPFERVMRLYRFDRKLRLLMLDAVERIEVSLRSRWANQMALRHGAMCLQRANLFRDADLHRRSLESLEHFYGNSTDEFTLNFRAKYPRQDLPPIWICSEMLSLGQLGKWIGNFRERRDRQDVAIAYGLDEECLLSFVSHLTEVRNLSAHHSRLWNRTFEPFLLPAHPPGAMLPLNRKRPERLYNTLVMVEYLLDIASTGHSWARRLQHSLQRHPEVRDDLGFP